MTTHTFVDTENKTSTPEVEDTNTTPKVEEVKRNFQPRPDDDDPLYKDRSLIFKDPYEKQTGEELKARLATVLDRGVTLSRLDVPLPSHLHGEWVPADKMEILYKQSLGFWIDTEFASSRALHEGEEGGIARIGDCIFMVCRKEVREAVEEIRNELYEANNSKKGPQKEEKDFRNLTQQETAIETPVVNKSSAEGVDRERIKAALTATS